MRQKGQLYIGDKALDLATKMVTAHANVEPANELLTALFGGVGLLCEKNQACTGAPDWLPRDSDGNRLAYDPYSRGTETNSKLT